MSEPIRSVEEFVAWTKQLQGRFLLYRGLADAAWEVESSAHRRIRMSENLPQVPPVTFQNYIEWLLENSGLQGFRHRQGRELSDLELLAELQHYGAATCLIDFTANALVALWFACAKEPGKAGKVVAMATDDSEYFSTVSYDRLKTPIKEFLFQNKLWKWEPSGMSNRMIAQQSVFVFGEGKIEEGEYKEIEIDTDGKQDIMETLEKSFGITARRLFNDFAGFALWNASSKPYTDFTAEDFFSLGLLSEQQGDDERATYYFEKAIERMEEPAND